MIAVYPGIIPESVQYLHKFSENLGSRFFRHGFPGKNPIVKYQIFDRNFLSEFSDTQDKSPGASKVSR